MPLGLAFCLGGKPNGNICQAPIGRVLGKVCDHASVQSGLPQDS